MGNFEWGKRLQEFLESVIKRIQGTEVPGVPKNTKVTDTNSAEQKGEVKVHSAASPSPERTQSQIGRLKIVASSSP